MTQHRITESGTYTGNGTSQTISLPWTPAFVVIVSGYTGATVADRGGVIAFDSMPAASAFVFSEDTVKYQYVTTGGVTFAANQFSVGSNTKVNKSGETVYWFAIQQGSWIDTGSYTGNQGQNSGTSQTVVVGGGRDCNRSTIFCGRATAVATGWNFGVKFPTHQNVLAFGLGMSSTTAEVAGQQDAGPTYGGTSTPIYTGFRVANSLFQTSGTACRMNLTGTTYYYAVLHPTEGGDGKAAPGATGSDSLCGSTSFGIADTGTVITDATEITVTLGENVKFVVAYHRYNPGGGTGTHDAWLQISFDPMPAQASFFLDATNCGYRADTSALTRQSNGFKSGIRVDSAAPQIYFQTIRE